MLSHVRRTTVVFAFLIAVLLFSFFVSYRTTFQVIASEDWLIHTYSVVEALDKTELALTRADSRAKDFILTQDPKALSDYRQASAELDGHIATVRNLTVDNPSQQLLAAGLVSGSALWKQQWEQAIASPAGTAHPPANQHFQDSLDVLNQMKAVESTLLRERAATAAARLQTKRLTQFASAGSYLVFLLLAAYMIMQGERERAKDRESRLRLAAIVDSSDDAIISKTLDGTLTSWNAGAERLYGYNAEEMIGKSIYSIIPPTRKAEMETIFTTLREGHRVDHLETVRLTKEGKPIHVELTVSPVFDERGKIIGASAIARNISDRKRMEESLRQLSVRILQAEDEERRRIARDLHDTTVQELALLSMNLAQLKGVTDPAKLESTLNHAHQLTNQCVQELRTLSYLLHPPMLDELGLASALKIYAEGFSQRSGVSLDIEVSPSWQRLPPEMEIALFRVAQESLSNVIRHSGSPRANIKLDRNGEIRLAIIDEGRGVPNLEDKEITWGVGILGMRERIKQLGGSLTIDSGSTGTTVEVRLPC